MAERVAKDALYEGFAVVAKALSSGRRAEIVDLLAQGERSVEEVAGQIDQSVANTSHHLRALARAGLVTTRRDGTRIHYSLASERVGELWSAVRVVAEQHAVGLDRLATAYLGDRQGIDVIDRKELLARLKDGTAVVLDVRPEREFAAGHIAGARSVPITELRRQIKALPKDAEVVAYCRGPYCVMALDAVEILRAKGFRAHRMEHGVVEWRAKGGRVQTGSAAGVRP